MGSRSRTLAFGVAETLYQMSPQLQKGLAPLAGTQRFIPVGSTRYRQERSAWVLNLSASFFWGSLTGLAGLAGLS